MRKLTHEEISSRRIPQALASQVERLPIFGMLDNIRSLYNVGSIFRTSDGALVKKLFLCGYTAKPPRKEIEKTALHATKTVPWEYCSNPLDAVSAVRSMGGKMCVLEQTTKSIPYYHVRKTDFPICLVIGNEITGISSDVVAAADMAIEIPMFGMKQSLNAAVAYGIALFDLIRIWKSP
ncbi:MAG: TrmH family RNA methyltransferase [Ignavibacteria bacterium]|nr:TrmH family RNA methyltransferase [Ignavibacteria bacterium]